MIEDCVILCLDLVIVCDCKVKLLLGGCGVIFVVVGDGGRVRVWRENAVKYLIEFVFFVVVNMFIKGGDDNDEDFEVVVGMFMKCVFIYDGNRLIGVSGDARLLTY